MNPTTLKPRGVQIQGGKLALLLKELNKDTPFYFSNHTAAEAIEILRQGIICYKPSDAFVKSVVGKCGIDPLLAKAWPLVHVPQEDAAPPTDESMWKQKILFIREGVFEAALSSAS